MRATVRVRMATDKGVAAGLAWDDMSDGVCQAATLSVAIRGQQNFRQAGHGIGFGVISATPLLLHHCPLNTRRLSLNVQAP